MDIKINVEGMMFYRRKGKWHTAKCPFVTPQQVEVPTKLAGPIRTGIMRWTCGDYCALFGEPESVTGRKVLPLCHKAVTIDSLVDERKGGSNGEGV